MAGAGRSGEPLDATGELLARGNDAVWLRLQAAGPDLDGLDHHLARWLPGSADRG